jgi:hypothetical protein
VTSEQIRALVTSLPEDSACFRTTGVCNREAQIAHALSEPRFGWIVGKAFADHGLVIPSAVRIPSIRRANYHLLGYSDQMVKGAIALTRPQQQHVETMLKGLLSSRDIDVAGIADYLSIPAAVVTTYGDLFFNVHDRLDDAWYMSGIAYPETRIGQVVEAEQECDNLDLAFIRAGYESGWQAVAKLGGSALLTDDEDLDVSFRELEKEIVGNSVMLTWLGHLNREKSPGLANAQGLLTAAQKEPKRDEAADQLPSISVPEALQESMDRLMRDNQEYKAAMKAQEMTGDQAAKRP